ncbi:MAG: type II toxin-antitoxin system prevent-host-death family antitoxin [Proteobacteria bacterium]|nr:type II toxin-antitoxin system prevent-host-death family antitoxin [Pseudomonadota bacterium]
MRTVTAKDLKNKTGDAIQAVSRGEKIVVTLRGKPVALISPINAEMIEQQSLRDMDVAWDDIGRTLQASKPRFKNVEEAMGWTRKRS